MVVSCVGRVISYASEAVKREDTNAIGATNADEETAFRTTNTSAHTNTPAHHYSSNYVK